MSASAAFEPLLWMLLFGVVASVPALIVAKMIAPRRRFWNPVKYMPMECGQVPSGEGRTRFMMQYYSYVLMFVAIRCYTDTSFMQWGVFALCTS